MRSHVVIQEMFDIFYQQKKREYNMFEKNLCGRALLLIVQSLEIFVDFSYKYYGTQISNKSNPN